MNERFGFGKNWTNFLKTMNNERLYEAMASLGQWLDTKDLSGKSFLDIGSGSGLFSLAARKMGADVCSFDYDYDCVKCTQSLKDMYYKNDDHWTIEQGDALDKDYLSKYLKKDIVYSWGVLHHTGNMYKALENAGDIVADGGLLYIAIYNKQKYMSTIWKGEKKIYNKMPDFVKFMMVIPFFLVLWTARFLEDIIRLRPFYQWKTYKKKRGMSPWYDAVDWVGGYPFEVAKPDEILEFYHKRGFTLEKLKTYGGTNKCNQYLFRKCK